MAEELTPAIRLFYCYSAADKSLCEELDKYLVPLQRTGRIKCWSYQMISPGRDREAEIRHQLNAAQIILLLVSPDFLASYYCYEKEMKLALQRHEAGVARVIPVILRHADWKDAPFSKLQALPADERPIINWSDHDEFFVTIVAGIRKVTDEMVAKQGAGEREAHPDDQNAVETASSSQYDQVPSSGKYTIHAHEMRVSVQGDNFGTINNRGLDLSELLKLRELLRDDPTS